MVHLKWMVMTLLLIIVYQQESLHVDLTLDIVLNPLSFVTKKFNQIHITTTVAALSDHQLPYKGCFVCLEDQALCLGFC